MIEYLKGKLLNWRYTNAKRKAIELKLETKQKHVVLLNGKSKFHVISKQRIKHLNKKMRKKGEKEFTWQFVLKNSIYQT